MDFVAGSRRHTASAVPGSATDSRSLLAKRRALSLSLSLIAQTIRTRVVLVAMLALIVPHPKNDIQNVLWLLIDGAIVLNGDQRQIKWLLPPDTRRIDGKTVGKEGTTQRIPSETHSAQASSAACLRDWDLSARGKSESAHARSQTRQTSGGFSHSRDASAPSTASAGDDCDHARTMTQSSREQRWLCGSIFPGKSYRRPVLAGGRPSGPEHLPLHPAIDGHRRHGANGNHCEPALRCDERPGRFHPFGSALRGWQCAVNGRPKQIACSRRFCRQPMHLLARRCPCECQSPTPSVLLERTGEREENRSLLQHPASLHPAWQPWRRDKWPSPIPLLIIRFQFSEFHDGIVLLAF